MHSVRRAAPRHAPIRVIAPVSVAEPFRKDLIEHLSPRPCRHYDGIGRVRVQEFEKSIRRTTLRKTMR